jgi:hypothetical protein
VELDIVRDKDWEMEIVSRVNTQLHKGEVRPNEGNSRWKKVVLCGSESMPFELFLISLSSVTHLSRRAVQRQLPSDTRHSVCPGKWPAHRCSLCRRHSQRSRRKSRGFRRANARTAAQTVSSTRFLQSSQQGPSFTLGSQRAVRTVA